MSSLARPTGRVGGIPRVNLLPRIEIERRERLALGRRWLIVVLVAILAIAGVSAGAYTLNSLASTRLAAENARTTTLLGQIADLADVSKVRATQRDLEGFRTQAMGADVAWAPVYAKLSKLVPASADIVGWDLTTGPLPAAGEPAEQTGVTGKLTVTSSTAVDIVALVRDMRTVEGVVNADGVELSREGSGDEADSTYTYTVTVDLDQTAYTGRFAEEKGK